MINHTPGPWTVERIGSTNFIRILSDYSAQSESVCAVGPASLLQRNANANLIAAAPDMLAALRRIADWIERTQESHLIDTDENPGQAVRDAIAKAEGDGPFLGRPSEERARRAVEEFLTHNAPGFPDYTLIDDGEDGYAFYVVPQDTTSYLHRDMSIEWYGTGWPNHFSYDEGTGDFLEIAAKAEGRS